MTRSRSKGRAVTPTPADVAAARERRQFALADLDIAPENLRYGEPADDDIQVLAETLLAAGQLQPLTVRPGCGPAERPAMALDGRRRLLALRHLAAEGRIADNHPVEVFVETDPARQAAAAVLTNTAAPIHVADVIAAIGRMVTSGLKPAEISRALGYAEIDIKRLAALSALPPVALEALRAGRMNLRQARLLARLADPSEQAALAQDALEGRGFADWRVTERLDENRVTTQDPRFALVGADGYAASGGRVEADLFGERASVLLDPDRLTAAWTARARRLALVFEAEGLAVHVAAGPETWPMTAMPDDLERLHYVYGGDLTERQLDDYRAARDHYEAAAEDAAACLAGGPQAWRGSFEGLDDWSDLVLQQTVEMFRRRPERLEEVDQILARDVVEGFGSPDLEGELVGVLLTESDRQQVIKRREPRGARPVVEHRVILRVIVGIADTQIEDGGAEEREPRRLRVSRPVQDSEGGFDVEPTAGLSAALVFEF